MIKIITTKIKEKHPSMGFIKLTNMKIYSMLSSMGL